MKPRQLAALVVVLIVPALLFAACGGDDDSTGSTSQGNGGSTETTESTGETAETLVPEPPTEPPTEIEVTEPLSEAPEEGKTVTFLQCEFPVCGKYAEGVKEATEALGWDAQIQVFKNTEPEKALQQAIAGAPDYIAISGIPAQLMKSQLAAAEKAGIPVVSCAAATPEGPGEEYVADCGHTLGDPAGQIRDWIINDSQGKAKIVGVSIPQYPILATEIEQFEGENLSECPECSFDLIEVTPEEVAGGAIPQKLTAFLQSNPDTDYVFLAFGDLAVGVDAALQSAGLLDQVKLTGVDGTPPIFQAIGDTMAAWTAEPVQYSGWVMVDAMARLSVGDEITPEYKEVIATNPAWTLTTPEAAELLEPTGYVWFGPENYQGQFEELWQLGG